MEVVAFEQGEEGQMLAEGWCQQNTGGMGTECIQGMGIWDFVCFKWDGHWSGNW